MPRTIGYLCYALIAQLVEQLPLKQTVVGSNPTGRTKTYFDISSQKNSMTLFFCMCQTVVCSLFFRYDNYIFSILYVYLSEICPSCGCFFTGACVLVVEIVATRVLSPYFGNTLFMVSSVISVILAALSCGYYLGGRMADKNTTYDRFFQIILVSGITLLAAHACGVFVLPMIGYLLPITIGPLLMSLLLFFLPALLLGTLSPYAVALQVQNGDNTGVGSASGVIFFWSTIGSIAGSLLAGFVLVPYWGINTIIIIVGASLCIVGIGALLILKTGKRSHVLYLAGMIIVASTVFATSNRADGHHLFQADGMYERITIYDGQYQGRATRFFQQDRSSSAAMFLDSDDLVYDYTKYYALYKVFTPNLKDALIIGGGAYSIPKILLKEHPTVQVHVSEIEPSLYSLSKKYFNLEDSERLYNHTDDGRRFLQDTDVRFSMIFSDVYHSLYSIPAHFTTQEFFTLAKERLDSDGIFVANIIGELEPKNPSFLLSEMKTFKSVFPNSYFFAVRSPESGSAQNIIFVGYNSEKTISFNDSLIAGHNDSFVRGLASYVIDTSNIDFSPYPLLTDNYAPVEYMIAHTLERLF